MSTQQQTIEEALDKKLNNAMQSPLISGNPFKVQQPPPYVVKMKKQK